jgi:hypothetical protein
MSKPAHKEAFALMWYACPCGHRERIWNSRDGVTPFGGLLCPSCNSTTKRPAYYDGRGGIVPPSSYAPGMEHIEFRLDTPAPDHKLAPGQRFWRDGTKAEAIAILERRFTIFAERGQPAPQEVVDKMLDQVLKDHPESEFRPGWPHLERNPDR